MDHCVECGSVDLVNETRLSDYSYKGHTIALPQKAIWCNNCGEGFLNYDDVKITEPAMKKFNELINAIPAKNQEFLDNLKKQADLIHSALDIKPLLQQLYLPEVYYRQGLEVAYHTLKRSNREDTLKELEERIETLLKRDKVLAEASDFQREELNE